MLIRQLALTHFKKHEETEFSFSQGLNAITGENRSGKSTLLKGILFALFGPRAVGVAENIPTWGRTDAKVSLECELPTHGWVTIERNLRNCQIRTPDRVIANGATACLRLVEEAYGLASADLQLLLASRQGESQALLAMGAAALQRTVEKLAKADVLDQVLSLLSLDIGRDKGHLDGLGPEQNARELRDYARTKRRWADEAQQTLLDAEAKADMLTRAAQQAKQALDTAVKAAADRQHMEATLADMLSRQAVWQEKLSELTRELAGYAPQLRTQLDLTLREEKETREKRVQLSLRVQDATRLLQYVALAREEHAKWVETVARNQQIKETVAPLERAISALQEELRERELEEAGARQIAQDAEKAVYEGVCHACGRAFNAEEQVAAEQALAAATPVWQALKEKTRAKREQLARETAEATRLRAGYAQGAEAYLPQAAAKLARLEAELAEQMGDADSLDALRIEEQALSQQWSDLSVQVKYLERTWTQREATLTQQAQTEENLARCGAAIGKLQAEMPEPVDVAAAQQVWHEAMEAKAQHVEVFLTPARIEAEESRTLAAHAETQAAAAEKAEAERSKLTTQLDRRTRLQKWLRSHRADLMRELWDGMLGYASHLLLTTTEGQLSSVYREDDVLWVVEDDHPVPVSEASGFQRSLLGLCLRIALSRVFLGHTHTLLLDEPTADASSENAARVAGMLQGLGSQVIFVSHREGDAANAASIIALT